MLNCDLSLNMRKDFGLLSTVLSIFNDSNHSIIPCLGQVQSNLFRTVYVKIYTLLKTAIPKTIPCPAIHP